MRNTKITTIILAIITILTLILDTVNLEPFGLDTDAVGKISAFLTIVKLVYDNWQLFSAQDVADFSNDETKNVKLYKSITDITAEDVKLWRKNR